MTKAISRGTGYFATHCVYCGTALKPRSFYCSASCRGRNFRKSPKGLKFKEEPPLLEMPVREWKSLSEFPNYEISNDGRVRRKTAGSNRKIGVLLRCGLSTRGYPEYRLTNKDRKVKAILAHRLVGLAFLPPPLPEQTFVLHGDDNKLNPRIDNLRWGTALENSADAIRNNRLCRGDDHHERKKRLLRMAA